MSSSALPRAQEPAKVFLFTHLTTLPPCTIVSRLLSQARRSGHSLPVSRLGLQDFLTMIADANCLSLTPNLSWVHAPDFAYPSALALANLDEPCYLRARAYRLSPRKSTDVQLCPQPPPPPAQCISNHFATHHFAFFFPDHRKSTAIPRKSDCNFTAIPLRRFARN